MRACCASPEVHLRVLLCGACVAVCGGGGGHARAQIDSHGACVCVFSPLACECGDRPSIEIPPSQASDKGGRYTAEAATRADGTAAATRSRPKVCAYISTPFVCMRTATQRLASWRWVKCEQVRTRILSSSGHSEVRSGHRRGASSFSRETTHVRLCSTRCARRGAPLSWGSVGVCVGRVSGVWFGGWGVHGLMAAERVRVIIMDTPLSDPFTHHHP
jgi:hypothetical protein